MRTTTCRAEFFTAADYPFRNFEVTIGAPVPD